MDTFAVPFMALVLTSPTIPSKFYWHVLYRIGVAGESIRFQFRTHLMIHFRCAAFPTDLDGGGPPRSRELADALKEAFSSSTLWDEWGMDADIKVKALFYHTSKTHVYSHLPTSFRVPVFIYCWHLISYTN